jgi:hypothetical protein
MVRTSCSCIKMIFIFQAILKPGMVFLLPLPYNTDIER